MTAEQPDMSRLRRRHNRARLANTIVIVLIVILAPVLGFGWYFWQTGQLPQLLGPVPPQIPPENTVETVIVPFDGSGPVSTTGSYSGDVTLVIVGSGDVNGEGYKDAFYRYTDKLGQLSDRPFADEPDLYVDDDLVTALLPAGQPTPDYNPFHVYSVPYNLGETPRPVTFEVRVPTVSVNTGQFQIYLVQPAQ